MGIPGFSKRTGPDAQNGPSRFIILFHPRCGSTWLLSMMHANRHFHIAHEILSDIRRAPDQIAAIEAFFARRQPRRATATGFKAAAYQIRDKAAFVETAERLGVRILLMTRDDLLKTAVSQLRVEMLVKDTKRANRVPGVDPSPPCAIEVPRLMGHLRRNETERNDVKFLAAQINRPVLAFTYEELQADTDAMLARIAEFLETGPIRSDKFDILKNTPDDLTRVITNHEEIAEALESKDYPELAAGLRAAQTAKDG